MPGDQLILQSLPKWSYPTFPQPFRMSYLTQNLKMIGLKVNKCRAL